MGDGFAEAIILLDLTTRKNKDASDQQLDRLQKSIDEEGAELCTTRADLSDRIIAVQDEIELLKEA